MQADVDSQEKSFISMPSTPLARASWGHLQSFTMELNSYLGMSNLLEKKKKVSQNGWHLAIFELWYFGWSVEKEVMMGIGGIMLQDNH